jgi:hypothetical protein
LEAAQTWLRCTTDRCFSTTGARATALSDITLSWILNKGLTCEPTNPVELVEPPASPYRTVDPKNAFGAIRES